MKSIRQWCPLALTVGWFLIVGLSACNASLFSLDWLEPSHHQTVDNQLIIKLKVKGQPDLVELLISGERLVALEPPYEYIWDTSLLEAGDYQLKARLRGAGQWFESELRLITVQHRFTQVGLEPCLPDQQAFTKDSLLLKVIGADKRVKSLELLLDGTVIATLDSSFSYLWDSRTASEGEHALKVRGRALGQALESASCKVVVDRTAPSIRQQEPAPDSNNVALSEAVKVTFSEPLDLSSLSAKTIMLKDTANQLLKTQVELIDKTLILRLAEKPSLPTTLTLSLRGLSDLAGNVMASQSWQWQLPRWQHLGEAITLEPGHISTYSVLAMGTDNYPVAAWIEAPPHDEDFDHDHDNIGILPDSGLFVGRWNGRTWEQLGSKLSTNRAYPPALVVDSQNRAVVAWHEAVEHKGHIDHEQHTKVFVSRWNGSSWESLGTLNLSLEHNAAYGELV